MNPWSTLEKTLRGHLRDQTADLADFLDALLASDRGIDIPKSLTSRHSASARRSSAGTIYALLKHRIRSRRSCRGRGG